MIPQWKMKSLIKLGEDYKCPFILPPFKGDINEGSYDIHKFKNTPEFQKFLVCIMSFDVKFEYAKYKKHIFMTIKVNE